MQTSAQNPESTIKPTARFCADRLRWVFAAQADILDPRTYLQKVLIEPCPEGGVYVVATNGALLMIAYDAKGTASHRFTFDPLHEIAAICGYPIEDDPIFSSSIWADTIVIDGDTLSACRAWPTQEAPEPVLFQKIKIGEEFPSWQPLARPSGPTNPVRAFVQKTLLEIALYGLKNTPAEMSLHRYSPQGADTNEQPVHITFSNLPLRGVLMPLKTREREPIAGPVPMPFDA